MGLTLGCNKNYPSIVTIGYNWFYIFESFFFLTGVL